jgi:hypothetical protein
MSESEAQKIGKARQAAHPRGTPRLYDDPNTEDIMGVAGELAFGERYGLEIDREIRPEGDGHVDFWAVVNGLKVSIDVKANRNAHNLLIKQWEIDVMADIAVLAKYNGENDIEFLGWDTKGIMRLMPLKAWGPLEVVCYYRHRSQLRSMRQLDTLLGVSRFL